MTDSSASGCFHLMLCAHHFFMSSSILWKSDILLPRNIPLYMDNVLVTYGSIANYPMFSSLKQTSKNIVSHSFWVWGISEWLSWVVLAQGLSWGCHRTVSWSCSPWRLDGLGEPLVDSFTWLLAGSFSSSPSGPLRRAAADVASLRVSDPQREREGEKKM